MADEIVIHGARTHNLRNLNLRLPRDRLCVVTGLSGSGKSSLAFDTLYAEGQRRYVESLSSYARQFLELMDKPDVDEIDGLSPAISIEQKSTSRNPRSTVGTITEIHDYLRLLWARVGEARCPEHQLPLKAQTITQMVDTVLALPAESRYMILAPVVRGRKGEYRQLFMELTQAGFLRARVDGEICELTDPPKLALRVKHNIEVVVDRFRVRPEIRTRVADSLETALKRAEGLAIVAPLDASAGGEELTFSSHYSCPVCGFSLPELEPRDFSFNNPHGACPGCDGLGSRMVFDEKKVVPDREKSVHDGAIVGWERGYNMYYYHLLEAVAEHYHIDLEKPFGSLSAREQELLLHGTGTTAIALPGLGGMHKAPFEGVINNFTRRVRETSSENVREYLAQLMTPLPCPDCRGARIRREYRHVFVAGRSLPEICDLSVRETHAFFEALKLDEQSGKIAARVLQEIKNRLNFLMQVGLDYLSLSRSAETLSGGEAQRIRLASQIGAGLVGVMYILAEPSIGLHQRDNARLIEALLHLRDLGNTVIVVEHDEETIRAADFILDVGPGAGVHGGTVVAQGGVADLEACPASLTGDYLSGRRRIEIPAVRHRADKDRWLTLKDCTGNNLRHVTAAFPVGCLTVVTGVSGSGKSTLVNDTLVRLAERRLNRVTTGEEPAACGEITGLEYFDKLICIDQSPIGRTPRSTPATYVGLYTDIRNLFARTAEARARGYTPGRFSFNVRGGRCEACQGDGTIRVPMNFMSDVYVQCEQCHGARYNRETLEIHFKGRNIAEVLDMTVEEAYEFFRAVPALEARLKTLMDVGLPYIKLGQVATTFSGGEAQRIKLSKELSRRATGRTLYVLDEPTTGLHFHDVRQLLEVLCRLRDEGNTVIVIEHNLDVIKTGDYLIDLGPEGGAGGGTVIARGPPEEVAACNQSYTGQFLRRIFEAGAVRTGEQRHA